MLKKKPKTKKPVVQKATGDQLAEEACRHLDSLPASNMSDKTVYILTSGGRDSLKRLIREAVK